MLPGLSTLHLLPILSSFHFSPTFFLTKTTLNLIPITAKTKRLFVSNPLKSLFGEMSVIDSGNAGMLRGFKGFLSEQHWSSCKEDRPRCWTGLRTDGQLVLQVHFGQVRII